MSVAALEVKFPDNEKIITCIAMINLVPIGQKDRAGIPLSIDSNVITLHMWLA